MLVILQYRTTIIMYLIALQFPKNLFENGDPQKLYLGEILRQPHWLHSWAPRLSRGRPRSGQMR